MRHPLKGLLTSLAMLAVVVVALFSVQGTARAASVVGHVDVAIASNAQIANPGYTAEHENVVILQPWETTELRALRAANPSVKVLMYENASSASTSASATGVYPTGVSYGQAAAHHWLLKNTSGQTFTFGGENWLYAANIGSRGYQDAWAANVLHKLHSAPWSGVFIDDLNPTIEYHDTPSSVARYPTNARYGAAMGRFIHRVGHRLLGAHELAIANIGSWSGFTSVVDPWLRSLSGAMDEEFVKWGTTAGSGYANEATWKLQLHEVALDQREHKLFIGITHSSAGDAQAAVYGYATELLAGDGHAIFSMNSNYSGATWFPEYDYTLGRPLGGASVDSRGVYSRSFSEGRVLVNPTTAPETVSLDGVYSGSGYSHARQVRIAPHSGLVLTRG